MISQQTFQQRRRQRGRDQMDQFTIPIEREVSRSLHDGQYSALWALREPIAQAIEAMRHDLVDLMDTHCDIIVGTFSDLLLVVKQCIVVLNGPDLTAEMRPYPLLARLSALHRTLIDAQVMVKNVRGQCRCGRLANDPCGSYWYLRVYLRDVVQGYQCLLSLLQSTAAASAC